MKRTFKYIFSFVALIALFASCAKDSSTTVNHPIEVTLVAGNPDVQPSSRTLMDGATPKWCDGDAIGVSNGTSTNVTFAENSIGDGETAVSATFSGKVSSAGTYYAYYPHSSNGVSSNGAKVDIPLTQRPTATSFDGTADIMVSKSFTVSTNTTTTIENLQFARLGAIVKVVLIDDSPAYDLSSEHPTTVSLTAASNLVGRVYVDMVNQELGELYSGQSKTVTAAYTALTQFAIDGSNAAYFIVYPQTLASGSTLTLSATTEHYNISKDITVPGSGIVLESGKITTLNISIEDSHVSAATVYANVEASDWDYSFTSNPWGATSGNVDLTSGSTTINWNLSANYAAYNSNVLALNTGSNTNEATISSNNVVTNVEKVVVYAKTNSGKEVTLSVKVGDTVLGSETLNSVTSLTEYTFSYATPLSGKVSIEFTSPTGGYQIKEIKINPKIPVTLSFASAALDYDTDTYGSCTGQTATASPNVSAITENITYALSGASIGTVNASTGVVTLNGTVGSATITASFDGDATYSAAVGSYTITVTSTDANDGSLEHPYTASEARTLALGGNTNSYYITGYITNVINQFSAGYETSNFWIHDTADGSSHTFEGYKVKYFNNLSWLDGNQTVSVGDKVVIYGKLKDYVSGGNHTPETETAYLVSLNEKGGLTVPTLSATPDDANKQISVTWGAASGSAGTITYTVNCGAQSYEATAAGSHTFTMADYGEYAVSVIASASDAWNSIAKTTVTITSPGGKTYTITFKEGTTYSTCTNSYTKSFVNTCDDLALTLVNINNGSTNSGWSTLRAGRNGVASTPTITTNSAIPEAIKTVTLHITQVTTSPITSSKLYVSSTSDFAIKETYDLSISGTGDASATITTPAVNKYYQIEIVTNNSGTANGFLRFDKIIYTTD